MATSTEEELARLIDRYDPAIAAVARAALAKMRARLPGAVELVYDNYNALVIGFSPTERSSDAVFSIALYPRWVTLFFLRGAGLPDPKRILKGAGKRVRHIVLADAAVLETPAVRELMTLALQQCAEPFDRSRPGRLILKSVSAKQRPRRHVKAAKDFTNRS